MTLIGIISLIGFLLGVQHFSRKQIKIDINGTVQEVRTRTKTVADLLDEVNIYLDEVDHISPSINAKLRSGMTVTITRAKQLVLDNNGEIQRLYTHTSDPLVILAENDVFLSPYDQLYVNNQPINLNAMPNFTFTPTHLKVLRSKQFTIIDDGQLVADGYTTAATVGELLSNQAIILYAADQIVPQPNTPLTEGLQITIKRSQPLTIQVDNQQIYTRAIGSTVEDVLIQLGFGLTGSDYTIPNAPTTFQPNMTIEIVRVVETIEIEQVPIIFQTFLLPDPNLPIGERSLVQEGVFGIRESRIKIRRENNQIVSRVIQSSWVAATPIPQIMSYGTHEVTADLESTPER